VRGGVVAAGDEAAVLAGVVAGHVEVRGPEELLVDLALHRKQGKGVCGEGVCADGGHDAVVSGEGA
jgi:hypothetical protein